MARSTLVRVRNHPFFRSIRVTKPALSAGDQQCIDVSVKNPVQEVIVLSATVTYGDGELDIVSAATTTQRGQLRWQIPAATSSGRASVVVSAGSGGCCGGDLRKRSYGTLAAVEGSFDVLPAAADATRAAAQPGAGGDGLGVGR